MNLAATLALNAAPFLGPLGQASASLGGLTGLLGRIAAPLAALTAGISSLAGAFSLLRSSIGEAAKMETLEGSFTTLLGSASAARQRMAELAAFAATTPFEVQGLAQTSRLLQSFTGAALATGPGLRLVGDAAAAVGQPLEAVSMWFGRLYAGLKDGLPLGEPIQNLTQLGLISGETRRQLLALQGQSMGNAQIMQLLSTAFAHTAGAMERLSSTYEGKLSTMRDGWKALKIAIGEPIRDALLPFLDRSTARLEGMVPLARRVGSELAVALRMAGAAMADGTWPTLLKDVVTLALAGAVNTFAGLLVGSSAALLKSLTKPSLWAGLGEAMLGSLISIRGALTEVFRAPAAAFSATILYAVEQAKVLLGKIPVIRDQTGLAGYEAKPYAQLYQASKSVLDPSPAGEALQASGVQRMLAPLAEIKEAFAKGFDAVEIFDTAKLGASIKTARAAILQEMRLEEGVRAMIEEIYGALPAAPKTAEAETRGGLGSLMADRLTRIGGFIGGAGGPALDYARRTATAAERTAGEVRQLRTAVMARPQSPASAAWA